MRIILTALILGFSAWPAEATCLIIKDLAGHERAECSNNGNALIVIEETATGIETEQFQMPPVQPTATPTQQNQAAIAGGTQMNLSDIILLLLGGSGSFFAFGVFFEMVKKLGEGGGKIFFDRSFNSQAQPQVQALQRQIEELQKQLPSIKAAERN